MAKNAIHILSSDSRLALFKKQALDHAKKFDINEILPLYENLYNKVIQQNNI